MLLLFFVYDNDVSHNNSIGKYAAQLLGVGIAGVVFSHFGSTREAMAPFNCGHNEIACPEA
jgi:hypothetical protein